MDDGEMIYFVVYVYNNRFRGIGIRIEDEVLITDTGHEVC
jgi:Xaa-Pro aminopeptidase